VKQQRQDISWVIASMVLLACNALDAALTVCAVEFGDAVEANPVMALLLAHGTLSFVIVKHLLVSCGLILLWSLRERRAARVGIWAVVPLYPLIVIYEVVRG
jgi:hypothetical protein